MKTKLRFISIVIALFLVNCTSMKSPIQKTIGPNGVEQTVKGNGSPTIVFETGMGPSIDTWDKILDSLSKHTQVYAYNRPGYGKSSLRNAPRDVIEVARQLRANLDELMIPPPYILVGHSAGGLYVNMFARLYPEETAGVIFIDASHPEQFEYFRTDQKLLFTMLVTATQNGNRKYEYDIVTNTLQSFTDAPEFPDVPISVLTAGKSSPLENRKLREKWLEFQKELSNLSNDTEHRIVEESGHYIHRDAPELTINEILRIVEIAELR